MNNHIELEKLNHFMDNILSDDESLEISNHISGCTECSKLYTALSQVELLDEMNLLPDVAKDEIEKAEVEINQIAIDSSNIDLDTANIEFQDDIEENIENSNKDVRNQSPTESSIQNNENDQLKQGDDQMKTTATTSPQKIFGEKGTNEFSFDVLQSYPDTCAIKAQQLVLEEYGINVSEEQLIAEATYYGWYNEGYGTKIEDMGKLLELHGLDGNGVGEVNYFESDGNIYSLINEIAQGRKILIPVDADELWDDGIWEDLVDMVGFERPDHAVVLAGIDTSDLDNIKVIITDPGMGHLNREYPLEQFMDSWADSGYSFFSTSKPVPPNDAMVNFNYETCCLENIGELTWSEYQSLQPIIISNENGIPDSLLRNVVEGLLKYGSDHNVVVEGLLKGGGDHDVVVEGLLKYNFLKHHVNGSLKYEDGLGGIIDNMDISSGDNDNTFDLAYNLMSGHKVMLTLNPNSSLDNESVVKNIFEELELNDIHNDVLTCGIDTTNLNDIKVLVSDQLTGQVSSPYNFGEFIVAMKEPGYFMVSTLEMTSCLIPGMENYTELVESYHLPFGMSWEEFLKYKDEFNSDDFTVKIEQYLLDNDSDDGPTITIPDPEEISGQDDPEEFDPSDDVSF